MCLFGVFLAGAARADTLLFDSHDVLEISIPLNFRAMCRPRDDPDCDYVPTTLDYVDEHGKEQSLRIEAIIRGGWRSLARNCSAPLLFIRFSDGHTADTPFEGQGMLPLTTHCGQGMSLQSMEARQHRSIWEQYLFREYLAHRLYNVITDVSLNARLVKITYPNPDKPSRSVNNYAFFTEHFDSVADRNGMENVPRHSFDHEKLNGRAADKLSLFQFMIGNTDWSIQRERNITMLQKPDGTQYPLPYDFDMSGLVDAHYAGPAPSLPVSTVRDRFYLGYCHPETDWDSLFTAFLDMQDDLLSMVGETPGLDRKSTRSVNRFLDKFFRILETPEDRNAEIVNHCQAWPPDPDDHMRPFDK